MFYKLRKIILVWINQADHEKGVRAHLWQSLTTECPLSEEVYLLNVFACAFLTLAAKHRTTFPTFYTHAIFLYFIANKGRNLGCFLLSYHPTKHMRIEFFRCFGPYSLSFSLGFSRRSPPCTQNQIPILSIIIQMIYTGRLAWLSFLNMSVQSTLVVTDVIRTKIWSR